MSKYSSTAQQPAMMQELVKAFSREVLRKQPADLYEFGAAFFEAKIAERELPAAKSQSAPDTAAAATAVQSVYRGRTTRRRNRFYDDEGPAVVFVAPAPVLDRTALATSLFAAMDADKNGSLNKEEWSQNKFIKDSFDKDEDGKITLEELTKGFGG